LFCGSKKNGRAKTLLQCGISKNYGGFNSSFSFTMHIISIFDDDDGIDDRQ